ncbi:hypothetical protein OIU84_026483 [Salix udensis]|uniref:Uncharacterized protein n=1 Tax=Salix udensis TaxID=889485 RepID=A0AAD6KMC3_9ROSI|nr:hypothetical protein OIU84_026483 [Salix udensis]
MVWRTYIQMGFQVKVPLTIIRVPTAMHSGLGLTAPDIRLGREPETMHLTGDLKLWVVSNLDTFLGHLGFHLF